MTGIGENENFRLNFGNAISQQFTFSMSASQMYDKLTDLLTEQCNLDFQGILKFLIYF